MNFTIDSPFAQFDGNILTCKLCKLPVKGAKVWTAHVNGKQHRQKLLELKSRKSTEPNNIAINKRPASDNVGNNNLKRMKLSESNTKGNRQEEPTSSKIPMDFFDNSVSSLTAKTPNVIESKTKLPTDVQVIQTPSSSKSLDKAMEAPSTSAIPEGFFDDKKLDAKARNVELKDPLDEEWQRFQKEIQQAQTVTDAIVEEDDERLNIERTLDEIDEEMRGWAKVNELEKRVEKTVVTLKVPEKMPIKVEDFSDDVVDSVTLEDVIDWRSKQLWK